MPKRQKKSAAERFTPNIMPDWFKNNAVKPNIKPIDLVFTLSGICRTILSIIYAPSFVLSPLVYLFHGAV